MSHRYLSYDVERRSENALAKVCILLALEGKRKVAPIIPR
jgi:hypothetical protein